MQTRVKICKQCILKSTTPGVAINEAGLCSECVRAGKHPGYNLERLAREMETRFARARQEKWPYHALVRFSGGKDSAYLLYLLKNKYGLRPLAVAVVHPFLNSLSSNNIDTAARRLGIDLIKFQPDENMFIKFIRHGLLEGPRYGLGEDVGCDLCGYIYHWVTHRLAMRMNIPYLVDGVDPTEHEKPIFIDGEAMKAAMQSGVKYQAPVPDVWRDACGDEYRGSLYDQNPADLGQEPFPTTMSPFTFIPYDYKENMASLEKAGIMAMQDTMSGQTNCDVRHLFAYVSFKRYGCHPWEKQFALGLRRGYPTHIEQCGIGGAENLTRQDILDWLEDYKQGLFFIAENKTGIQGGKEILRQRLPTMVRILGEQGFSVMVDQMLKMHQYADYLGVALDQF